MKKICSICTALLYACLLLAFRQCNTDLFNNSDDILEFKHVKLLNCLIEEGYDLDGDKQISAEEAALISNLTIGNQPVTDLSGISLLQNLKNIRFFKLPLQHIDLSGMQNLELSDQNSPNVTYMSYITNNS